MTWRPRKMTSDVSFAHAVSVPGIWRPHLPTRKLSAVDMFVGPVTSDMPKSSRMLMSRDPKYLRRSVVIGAAPVAKRRHRSRPSAPLILPKMEPATRFAMQLFGSGSPCSAAAYLAAPQPLANVATLSFIDPGVAALAFMASPNFSQTRGTPKKTVGRTSPSVSLRDPLSASGRAKWSVQPVRIGATTSIICPAMWLRGR
mmetsp:Transcript_29016/g.93885  ORF Transcript_29016/g.93885 Transcript_29016/m.93885 type:complete len:200 (+) Transcript_29016:634-1233(+)